MIVIMFKPFGLMGTYEFSLRKLLFREQDPAIGGRNKMSEKAVILKTEKLGMAFGGLKAK